MKVSPEKMVYVAHRSQPGSTTALAAEELVTHLRIAGLQAEIAADTMPSFANFLIGSGWDEKTDREVAGMGPDGICIRDMGNQSLILTGKGVRGSLNAVYSFLEDQMGFVWFNASETHVPPAALWNFQGLDISYTPPFELRCIGAAAAQDYRWCARKRLNFFTDDPPKNEPLLEDCFTFAGKHCHNVYKLLSLGYFGTREDPLALFENQDLIRELHAVHPEYFALYKGRRDPYPGDIPGADLSEQCGNISLTNSEVVQWLVKGARLLLKHHPSAKLISLSLRDNYHYCEEAMASPGGVAGAMLRMVNTFAESLSRTHPEIRIDIIAYHGTQKPPESGKLHPAVSVRYCPIRVSQFHAFDESEHNLLGGLNYETPRAMSQPVDQIRQWRAIAERVVVWYYSLNLPYFHPHPSLRAHDRTFRILQQLGVSGVYIQDNKPMDWNVFNDLRVHLLTRLLWNPALDAGAETRRFCELYYGPAAPQVLAYIELLHEESVWDWENWVEADGSCKWERQACEESWDWFGEVPGDSYPKPHFYTLYHTRPPLKAGFFGRAKHLLEQALDAVRGQEPFASRLDEWRMSFYYGVLSSSCAGEDLEREAREWFIPRFDRLRRECRGKGFDGLDTLGLAVPKPALPAAPGLAGTAG